MGWFLKRPWFITYKLYYIKTLKAPSVCDIQYVEMLEVLPVKRIS